MAVTLSALRYLPGPDIGPELLRSARFYDIVIRGGGDGIDRSAFKRCCGGLRGKEHMVGPIKPKLYTGALGVVIGSIVLAYGCLKFYDIPVRKYLANRFLKHKNKI